MTGETITIRVKVWCFGNHTEVWKWSELGKSRAVVLAFFLINKDCQQHRDHER